MTDVDVTVVEPSPFEVDVFDGVYAVDVSSPAPVDVSVFQVGLPGTSGGGLTGLTPDALLVGKADGTEDQIGVGTAGQLLLGQTAAYPTWLSVSGDVASIDAFGVVTLAPLGLAKLDVIAAHSLVGNNTAGSASPVALTATQVKSLLAIAYADVSGLGTAAQHAATDFDLAGLAAAGVVTAEAYTDSSIAALLPVSIAHGGTGQTTQQAALNALAGAHTNNLVLAGDGTNVTLRALTVADLPTGTTSSSVPVGGVISAGGPQGDASHTQVLTWNAAGQVTAVTNTAIGSLDGAVITAGTVAVGRLPTGTGATNVVLGGTIGASSAGSASAVPVIAWNAAGQLTSVSTAALGTSAVLNVSTDTALSANSDTLVPSQHAVKTYVDTAVTGLLDFEGAIDASGNPNYPAANKGGVWVISVAGLIGGGSGLAVDVGDMIVATATNVGGTQAAVGASWSILEHNLVGALLSANNLSDVANAGTARTNLGLGTSAVLDTGTGASQVVLGGVVTAGGPTGDASHVAQVTYNAAGQLTAVASVAIALAGSAITSGTVALARLPTGTDNASVVVGGVITASSGAQGDAAHTQVLTWNAAGQVTVVTNTAIAVAGSAITSGTVALARLPTGTDNASVVVGGVITGAGPTGGAATVPVITYNAAGQLTTVTTASVAIDASAVTGGTLSVTRGGTGVSNPAVHAVYVGAGSSAMVSVGVGTAGQLLVGQGATSDPAWETTSGDVTIDHTGATTIAAAAVTLAKMANLAANSIVGNNTGSPATPLALTAAQVLAMLTAQAGAAFDWNAQNLSNIGTLTVNGVTVLAGTSLGTLTSSTDVLDVAKSTAVSMNSAGKLLSGVVLAPTVTWLVAAGGLSNAWQGYVENSVQQANTGSASLLAGFYFSFLASPTFRTQDTNAQTVSSYEGFYAQPALTVFNAGSLTITTLNQFHAAGVTVPTGAVVTTLRGLQVDAPTVNGTVTTWIGVSIATGAGSTHIGLRCLDQAQFGSTQQLTISAAGALATSSSMLSSSATAGVGYATGAGGTSVQPTNKTTAFATISHVCGTLTWAAGALAADTTVTSASSTNTAIAATDVVIFMHISGGTLGAYNMTCTPGSGAWTLTLHNTTAASLNEQPVFAFVIIKAVTS